MRARSEKHLIRKLRERDESAFNKVVTLYQHKVFSVVFRMIGDRQEAEDISQEVFISVFRSIDRFRGDSQFSTWLFRIAVNHTKNRIKYLARRQAAKQQPLDESRAGELGNPIGEKIAGPDKVAMGLELEDILKKGIAKLDDEQRALVVLRDIQGLTYAEISTISELPIGTVKSRLHRARLNLSRIVRNHMKG